MENINDVVKNKKCTGCSACLNICPVDAISMIKNSEGFLVPEIDNKKCIHCGLCNRVCPLLNKVSREKQYPVPKVYAGWNKDEKVRLKSSSGGVFSVLAEYFLKKKGYVCGASFDKKNILRHVIISSKKDLQKLRGSKYVQSEIGDIYKKIKKLLEKDKWVLFSGTPCQAAGLKNFLKKEYEKLLVVDIVCHGVPSPAVFKKYLEEVEKKNNKKITKINFRDKSIGWKSPQLVLGAAERENLIKKVLYDDTYGRGFLTNLYLRPACTDCIYSKWPKISDITLGDFWGIWKYKPELDDNEGTSLIMINNKKGLFIITEIKKLLVNFKNIPSEVAINNNYPVFISSDKHVNRESFFNDFSKSKEDVSQVILKHLDDENYGINDDEKGIGLLNFHYENKNFGANLVSFSLMRVIEKMGYKAKVINYCPFPEQSVIDKACSLNFYKFRQDFLKMTKICKTEKDLIKLNKQFSGFITGSDQVWRQLITGENSLHYFLDFALSSKKTISYGASFGSNHWEGDEITTERAKDLLSRFDSISVREKDGLDILLDKFNINDATYVLDPTVLLEKEDYEDLIKCSDNKKVVGNYIAYYFLFDNDGKIEFGEKMQEISDFTNYKIVNIQGKEEFVAGEKRFVYDSVPNFLDNIKNSNFVITDSFHGVLFSIIYKKDFICVGKTSKALSRFKNLFSILDLDVRGRFLSSLDEVKEKIFSQKIDYGNVYKRLNKEKKKSIEFLKNSLKKSSDINRIIPRMEKELIDEKITKTDLQTKSQELESQSQTLQANLKESESQNQALQTKSQELESRNQTLQTDLQESESQNQALQTKSQEFEFQNKTLQNTSQKLNDEIISLENSKSWRFTRPFRTISKLMSLIKKQGVFVTFKNIIQKIRNKEK